jgi:hypothetical protein
MGNHDSYSDWQLYLLARATDLGAAASAVLLTIGANRTSSSIAWAVFACQTLRNAHRCRTTRPLRRALLQVGRCVSLNLGRRSLRPERQRVPQRDALPLSTTNTQDAARGCAPWRERGERWGSLAACLRSVVAVAFRALPGSAGPRRCAACCRAAGRCAPGGRRSSGGRPARPWRRRSPCRRWPG